MSVDQPPPTAPGHTLESVGPDPDQPDAAVAVCSCEWESGPKGDQRAARGAFASHIKDVGS